MDARIRSVLRDEYGVDATEISRLRLGADPDTLVHRAVAENGTPYFVKLRSGEFDEASVAVPRFLSDQGVAQIIAPVPTRAGKLCTPFGGLELILYPFVEGRSAREVRFTPRHWIDLGAALERIHTAVLPRELTQGLQREAFSPKWREKVRELVKRSSDRELADFPEARRDEILAIVERADRLAASLRGRSPELTLCHSDLHAGNMLIDRDDRLFIVDWDNPILAPRERDLMFVGGAQGYRGHTPQEEEDLFYEGYGRTTPDYDAVAYYRYERIVQDVAVYVEELLSTSETDEHRDEALRWLNSNFVPGGTIEMARRSDRA